jgi:hypothetical protein
VIHGQFVPGAVYKDALDPLLGKQLDPSRDAGAYARSVIEAMAPRDALEEMLIAQLLLAHARVMHLTAMANRLGGLDTIRVANEYADRASNTYRRLMLALAEYRRPPRTGDTFAVVRQANIAGQQVIQNIEHAATNATNATNEQGFGGAHHARHTAPTHAPTLPPDTAGPGVPPAVRPAGQAVGVLHRPSDAGGQGPLTPERHPAR